jgi:phytoene dehydrogenase-like protein
VHSTSSDKYDIIIVGGGMAGSVAAAYLAKAGFKTVAYEKTPYWGGARFGSRVVGGCKTDRIIRLLTVDVRNGIGYLGRAAQETGARLRWQYLENSAVCVQGVHGPGEYMLLSCCCNGAAFAEMFTKLVPLPPTEGAHLAKVYDALREISEEEMEKIDNIPFREWLNAQTDSEAVRALFHKVNNTLIVGGSENASVPGIFGVAISMFTGDSNYGFSADGASDEIPGAFIRIAEEYGGEYKLEHEVKKVIVENKTAKGVVVRGPDGAEKIVAADCVIINSEIDSIAGLLGDDLPQDVSAALKSLHRADEYGISVAFAVDEDFWNPLPSQTIVVTPQFDFLTTFIYPDRYVRSLSPKGKQCILAGAFLAPDVYATKTKEQWGSYYRDLLEERAPGIKKKIYAEDCIVYRYPAYYGLFYGPKVATKSSTIQNLHFTGDYTQAPGVIGERAIASAMIAAKNIIAEKK